MRTRSGRLCHRPRMAPPSPSTSGWAGAATWTVATGPCSSAPASPARSAGPPSSRTDYIHRRSSRNPQLVPRTTIVRWAFVCPDKPPPFFSRCEYKYVARSPSHSRRPWRCFLICYASLPRETIGCIDTTYLERTFYLINQTVPRYTSKKPSAHTS